MRNEKFKEVSARVLLTPMPQDGTDQFTFMRPINELKPQQVEALLQFGEFLEPIDLLRGLNKLLSSTISNGDIDILPEEMIAIERTISYIADCWQVERGTFEPLHKKFCN